MYSDECEYKMDYVNCSNSPNLNMPSYPSTSTNIHNGNSDSIMLQHLSPVPLIQTSYSPNAAFSSNSMTPHSLISSSCTAASSPSMPMGMSAQSPGIPYSPISTLMTTNTNVSELSHNQLTPSYQSQQTPLLSMGNITDSSFIQCHNYSVEIYQSFKEDVDNFFSSNCSIQEQNCLIPQILQTVSNNLIPALEAEKNYLMNDVLCQWAIQQQKFSVAALWTQQQHYNLLMAIDAQFEYFGELLVQTLGGLQYLCEHFPKLGFEELFSQVRHVAHLFLFYSVIVARQPPAVVVKCGEAENHRRSRFWFNTELRILGGRAFGLHQSAENSQIQCFLVTDDTARKLRINAYYEISESEQFIIEPNSATFQTNFSNTNNDLQGSFIAKFDDMRVSKKEQLRREEVWKKRYHLCYNIHLTTNSKFQIELIGKKVSLPFAVLVGPKCDVEAKLFLERTFADFIRKPEAELPVSVHCTDIVNALEMKFQAMIEIPQKSVDQITIIPPRALSKQSKQHLIKRLKPDVNGMIFVDNFMKMPVAEEYCVRRVSTTTSAGASAAALNSNTLNSGTTTTVNDTGEWKLVPFFEWFFKLAELVNKNFVQLWNDGLIFGFCGKDEAELLLSECQRPTLLIRFSDYEFAKIKISVCDNTGAIRHHWYENQDLQGRSLAEELLHNSKFRYIEFIYPNINLEATLGPRRQTIMDVKRFRKPRNLIQPSPLYFNNQEPATRST